MNHFRKLLVLGTNHLVQSNLISLQSPQDERADERGHTFAMIADQPSVISWSDIGFGELRISVWWKYDHDRHPQANLEGNAEEFTTSKPHAWSKFYPQFVGAFASAWLERREGPYLQGCGPSGIFDTYMRRGEKDGLVALPKPSPAGYAAEGRVHF